MTVANGEAARPLPLATNVIDHSPTGFECGYQGSGSAQLALAILVDHFRHYPEDARLFQGIGSEDPDGPNFYPIRYHQDFKRRVIARLPRDAGWEIATGEVTFALAEIARERRTIDGKKVDS